MDTRIIELRNQQRDGYWHQEVFGLNVFDANRVADELDPILIILGALAEQYSCAAQIGWEPLSATTARTPEEYAEGNYVVTSMSIDSATPVIGNHSYERVPIGLYGGGFWYADKEWEFSYWIPGITAQDFNAGIRDYTIYDSLVIYASREKLRVTFDPCIAYPDLKEGTTFDDYWIKYSLQSFDLICTTGYDGYYFEAYAQSESKFTALQRGIDQAVDAIKSSEWYRANCENLYLDERSLCLKLKK